MIYESYVVVVSITTNHGEGYGETWTAVHAHTKRDDAIRITLDHLKRSDRLNDVWCFELTDENKVS